MSRAEAVEEILSQIWKMKREAWHRTLAHDNINSLVVITWPTVIGEYLLDEAPTANHVNLQKAIRD